MNPQTITERIHEASDRELKREVEAATEAIRNLNNQGRLSLGSLKYRDKTSKEEISAWTVLDEIKNCLFDGLRDKRREEAVSAFMSKVEKLSQDVEELQNSIPQ